MNDVANVSVEELSELLTSSVEPHAPRTPPGSTTRSRGRRVPGPLERVRGAEGHAVARLPRYAAQSVPGAKVTNLASDMGTGAPRQLNVQNAF
jgi:hypothetical protein